MIHLDEFRIRNLRKLEAYLRQDKLLAEFHMGLIYDCYINEYEERQSDCGSVGCAIGHGPYAGIPKYYEVKVQNSSSLLEGEGWVDYSHRCFIPDMVLEDEDVISSDLELSVAWAWLFSERWTQVDNTPLGAAKRINYFLTHERPPIGWSHYGGDQRLAFSKATVALYSSY